jgi:hypothetical protein
VLTTVTPAQNLSVHSMDPCSVSQTAFLRETLSAAGTFAVQIAAMPLIMRVRVVCGALTLDKGKSARLDVLTRRRISTPSITLRRVITFHILNGPNALDVRNFRNCNRTTVKPHKQPAVSSPASNCDVPESCGSGIAAATILSRGRN